MTQHPSLWARLFPAQIDNRFPGHPMAFWGFVGVTCITLWRSQHHMFAPDGGAESIATIPLSSYPDGAAGTVIGIFALWGLSQLLLGLVMALAAFRYRAMIPMLLGLVILEYIMRILLGAGNPIETAGSAPGAVANLPMIVIASALLGLCLWSPARRGV